MHPDGTPAEGRLVTIPVVASSVFVDHGGKRHFTMHCPAIRIGDQIIKGSQTASGGTLDVGQVPKPAQD
jgi:hypothetical protein